MSDNLLIIRLNSIVMAAICLFFGRNKLNKLVYCVID